LVFNREERKDREVFLKIFLAFFARFAVKGFVNALPITIRV